MDTAHELAVFAARQGLTPEQAVVLPALFDKAADAAGMHVRAMIAEATYRNAELGQYLASVARGARGLARPL
jgi:hypothetical protein